MIDKNEGILLTELKDETVRFNRCTDNIKNLFKKFDNIERSEKEKILRQISVEFNEINTIIDSLDNRRFVATNENVQRAITDQLSIFKTEKNKLKQEFSALQNQHKSDNNTVSNDDIEIKMREGRAQKQELINHGRDILKQDEQALNRIMGRIGETKQIGNNALSELESQNQKLKQVNSDLKEIDYSLNRAGKQLATMFKMYATDKIILCMIVLILLIIIAIIIVAAVGGDKDNKFNVPHDIFSNKPNNTTTRVLLIQ